MALEIISILPWEAAARLANSFRHGRIFLAGDAAHVMPPAGGFGLNTGVQDAHNLAWKLREALTGRADQALLRTYKAERMPAARLVLGVAVDEMEAPSPDAMPGQQPGSPEDTQWGKPPDSGEEEGGWGGEMSPEEMLIARLAPTIGYSYKSRAIRDDGSVPQGPLDLNGRPGTRAPHVWLQRGGEQISTLDLFGEQFVFLVGPQQSESWHEATQRARKGSAHRSPFS